MGADACASIQRYGQFLTQKQRSSLGWPSSRQGTFRPAPSYSALYNLLCKMNPHDFSAALCGWLAAAHGTLPRGLAVDGKYVRNLVSTLCLSEHESGALNCERESAALVGENDADYVFQLKANQPLALEHAMAIAEKQPLLRANQPKMTMVG